MRIVAGKFKNRELEVPRGSDLRPTSARVREAIFSALQSRDAIANAHVLELFAGSAALGFEALSRGAKSLVAVDNDPNALKAIALSAERFDASALVSTLRGDLINGAEKVVSTLARDKRCFDLVLMDPPYRNAEVMPALMEQLKASHLLKSAAWIVAESPVTEPFTPVGLWANSKYYEYGDTGVSIGQLKTE